MFLDLLSLLICSFLPVTTQLHHGSETASSEVNQQLGQAKEETVVSYKMVFQKYYEKELNQKSLVGSKFVDFETFCSTYYEFNSEVNILEYTERWKDIDTNDFVGYSLPISNHNNTMLADSNSSDASYILELGGRENKDSIPEKTPLVAFNKTDQNGEQRLPIYEFSDLYSDLNVGDIIYETRTIFWNAGHNALITSINKERHVKNSESFGNCMYFNGAQHYIETIEAVGSGVRYGFLDDDRFVRYGVKILRVTNAYYFRYPAVSFAKEQFGKPYSLDISRSNTSIDSNEWYCSELVWAAYQYSSWDICQIKGIKQGENGNTGGPLPWTIFVSDNTFELTFAHSFLELSLRGKQSSSWIVRINNVLKKERIVVYNSKMCFLEDCDNPGNLNDLKSIIIAGSSHQDVTINENFMANSITCWHDVHISETDEYSAYTKRYITYADNLNPNNLTLLVRNSIQIIGRTKK